MDYSVDNSQDDSRFRDFAEIAAEWFWELDAQLRFTYLSHSLQTITGLSSQSLIGQSLKEISSGPESLRNELLDVLNTHRAFTDFEFPWLTDSGQRILSISGRPRFDPNRNFLGFRGIGRDVTAERRALKAARNSEDQLRLLMDALPVCIAYVDQDMRYQMNNETYRSWFGVSPDQLLGERVEIVLGHDTFEEIKPAVLCALEGEVVEFEESLTDAAGLRRIVHTTLVPDVQNQGEVAGLFVLTRDISDQKRKVSHLEQSLSQLGAAMDGLDVALVALDSKAQIRMTNTAWRSMSKAMTGQAEEQIRSYKDLCTLLIADSPPETLKVVQRVEAFAHGEGTPFQADVLCPANGPDHWLSISTSEFTDQGERLVLVAHDDITERIRLGRELRDRDSTIASHARLNSLGELAATIAHELNQPLTAIGNYAAIAKEIVHSPNLDHSTLETALQRLLNESARAGAIINRVNNFVRQQSTNASQIQPALVVEEVVAWLAERAARTGIKIHVECDGETPVLWMDGTELEQVLYNLISNAIEAIERLVIDQGITRAGRIVASCSFSASGNNVLLSVSDNGPGVDDTLSTSVFDPFSSSRQSGLGLGLAICRSIVERHQGRLWFEPSESGGSVFFVQLPANGILEST